MIVYHKYYIHVFDINQILIIHFDFAIMIISYVENMSLNRPTSIVLPRITIFTR